MTKKRIYIFDTTLRDGEQVPGCQLNTVEKVEVARQLERLGVDIIEAGFPVSSPQDLKSVREIAAVVKNATVCALSRGVNEDIDAAYEGVKDAESARIHTFLPISDIQIENILRSTRQKVLQRITETVRYAKRYVNDVEWSGMDASRADFGFLIQAVRAAIAAGATTVNIPDTVGYAMPDEYGRMLRTLVKEVPELSSEVVLSVHVHNDLGMATANSLAGILAGARQVECTINGLGERAGNAALEEIAMILATRYKRTFTTNIRTKQISKTSRLVSSLMRMPVQKNKAIVGANAFAHSSGIHQDGILKRRDTFEIIDPADVGIDQSKLILTARSGRAALNHHLKRLGYELTPEKLQITYEEFLKVADRKKEVNDEDLLALVGATDPYKKKAIHMEVLQVVCGTRPLTPTATVSLHIGGKVHTASATGNGPIDASYKAVDAIVGLKVRLEEYLVQAITGSSDDLGKVHVQLSYNGRSYYGYGTDTDVVTASVKAYIDALNKIKTPT
jgi:2-isopropylmalate synthase